MARSRHNKGRKPRYKNHDGGLVKDGYLNEAVMKPLPASMLPGECEDCSGPTSPSATRCLSCFRKARATGAWQHPNLGYRSPCVGKIIPDARPASELFSMVPKAEPFLWNNYQQWTPALEGVMAKMLDAKATPKQVSWLIGKEESRIVNRAHERGLKLTDEWKAVLPWLSRKKVGLVAPLMQFPYIAKARPQHADILRVNALVPRFSEDMRADIVQSVMLALFEGTVTMAELERNKGSMTYFIKKWRKEQSPWQEMTGLEGGDDDDRSYVDIAASIKSESQSNDQAERRRSLSGWNRFQPATQIEAVYARQVGHAHWKLQNAGHLVSVREAAEELDAGKVSVWS